MKLILSLCILVGGIIAAEKPIDDFINQIYWSGQSSIQIKHENKTIYFDPYNLSHSTPADIILITHSHRDHYSPSDIQKIITPNTVIIAPKSCKNDIAEFNNNSIAWLEPGQDTTINSFHIKAIPAYNINKTHFHPKSNHWCGYVVDFGNITIYHAGDTERIPEMKSINCDIALLPLGQTYTMDSVKSAALAVLDIQPKVAIPIHFGMYERTDDDAQEFKKLLSDKIEVRILTRK